MISITDFGRRQDSPQFKKKFVKAVDDLFEVRRVIREGHIIADECKEVILDDMYADETRVIGRMKVTTSRVETRSIDFDDLKRLWPSAYVALVKHTDGPRVTITEYSRRTQSSRRIRNFRQGSVQTGRREFGQTGRRKFER